MKKQDTYSLIDSGNGRKLERFGPYLLDRPSAVTVWQPLLAEDEWKKADAFFARESESSEWLFRTSVPSSWVIHVAEIAFKISPTDFGHLGLFPEQDPFWKWIRETVREAVKARSKQPEILNLFAYSGGSTMAAAQAGAAVCHLDASKGMVAWARENAVLNELQGAPIRWIVDDVFKFLSREKKRGRRYDGIILDPPSFGRGSQGELFKIEEDIQPLLRLCKELLSDDPLFLLFSCHTPGFTPSVMENLLGQTVQGLKGTLDSGEMSLSGAKLPLPSGTFSRWTHVIS